MTLLAEHCDRLSTITPWAFLGWFWLITGCIAGLFLLMIGFAVFIDRWS